MTLATRRLVSLIALTAISLVVSFEVVAEWTVLDYEWDATHTYDNYINTSQFVPANCAITGIVVGANGDVYLSVPRWKDGVPATLNKLTRTGEGLGDYVLSPYPNWDMQSPGVDGDLQNCQAMTLSSKGVMFVIEVGRRNFFDANPDLITDGVPGVWQIDTNDGSIIHKYYFPESVASSSDSFVNDIVLDEKHSVAYLTDAWGDGGLIVYDYGSDTSRRYTGTSTQREPSYEMIVNGFSYGTDFFTTPSDGIAISDDHAAIFYCSLQGTTMFRLPTAVLRDFSSSSEAIDAAVEVLGRKEPSDGMMYWGGALYWGSLPESTYYAMKVDASSTPDMNQSAVPVWPDAVKMRWIDTFAVDWSDSSKLWFTSNKLDQFSYGTMDFTGAQGVNFRVISTTATDLSADSNSNDEDDDEIKNYKVAVGVLSAFLIISAVAAITAFVMLLQKKKTSEPMANL